MNDQAALMQAICAQPDEDTPRLALADYFDEHGEPERAEFMRLQIWHARNWPDHHVRVGCRCPSCKTFRRVGRLLTAARKREWAGAAFMPCRSLRFYRGCLETIELPALAFVEHAEAIFRAHPVTAVALLDRRPQDHRSLNADGVGFGWAIGDGGTRLRGPYTRRCDAPRELIGIMRRSPWLINKQTWLSWADFETTHLAQKELAAACVTWGRELAELPALAEEGVAKAS